MLEIIRDENKNIKAVCEYYIVDKNGILDDKGNYIWIQEVEINPDQKNKGLLKEFAKRIMEFIPQAQFGYFHRKRKYPDRGVRVYTKRQWLRLVEV